MSLRQNVFAALYDPMSRRNEDGGSRRAGVVLVTA